MTEQKPVHYRVPFYGNTPDNTHCYQAALKMILKYFLPEKEFSWEELETITAKVEGLWTWPIASMLWLEQQGFQLINIEDFDYHQFIEKGGQYLIDEYGEEVGNSQIAHSDIVQEQKLSQELIKTIPILKRIPALEDIKKLLNQGYLITSNVNGRILNDKTGYAGHSIVITGFNKTNLNIHNPGLPPKENQKVPFEQFEKAWGYPDEKSKNILAIKI